MGLESLHTAAEPGSLRHRNACRGKNLAYTLVRQEELVEAVVELREAIRLDPGHADARKEFDDVLDRLGDVGSVIGK